MDPYDITKYVVIIVVLIILSAFFSATETAYSSLNRARLKIRADSGKKSAALAYRLSDDYDRLLSTILIANNLVNILIATLSAMFFAKLITSQSVATTVATAVSTVALLIFGEITPKMLAKEFPEGFACFSSYIIEFFIIILYPLNLVFSGWKFLLKKIFRFKNQDVITEEELLNYVEEANEDGTLNSSETELISSAIEFNDAEVGDILVPRVQMVAIDVDTPMQEIKKLFFDNGFSRLPVYKGSIDSIIGMIHEKDFFEALEKGAKNINGIITTIAIATENMKISVLLRSMQRQQVHIAVVIDEYGGTLGLVTLEDILEELVGEIWDEHDEVVDYFTKLSDNEYVVDGNAEKEDFFELFGISDEESDANTVGGWVTEKCEDIPPLNHKFNYENLEIEITKRTIKKVLEIKVKVKEEEKPE